MRVLAALTLIAAASSGALRAQNPHSPPPADRLLRIQAVAADRQGNPVTNLKREDLEVWISGYRVPVESLTAVTAATADTAGRLIVLLMDDVSVDARLVPRAREVAKRFVHRMLPGDRMAVVRLNGEVMEISPDPTPLLRQIDRYNQTGGFLPPANLGAHVLGTIATLSREMGEGSEARKAIVAIGSGWVFDTPIPPPQVGPTDDREGLAAVRLMAAADISFYVIDPAGVGVPRAGRGTDGFARDAGGQAFINTNDLSGAVDRILRETSDYYTISVGDPPVGRTSPLRELEVKSLRRDVTVRARRMIPGGG